MPFCEKFLCDKNTNYSCKLVITNKEIIVIKDSYANSLIPFLVNHFKKVHVIDPRYYNLSITSYLKENPNIKDGLIIYNANGLDDSSILGLE